MNAAYIEPAALKEWRSKFKKKRRYPESDLATALCRWFDYASAGFGIDKRLFFHCKNESKQSAIAGSRMKAQGVRRGAADYLLLVPRGPYHGCAIELKAPGKKASPEQKEWLELVSSQGYYVAVCDALPTAMACIQSYLGRTL